MLLLIPADESYLPIVHLSSVLPHILPEIPIPLHERLVQRTFDQAHQSTLYIFCPQNRSRLKLFDTNWTSRSKLLTSIRSPSPKGGARNPGRSMPQTPKLHSDLRVCGGNSADAGCSTYSLCIIMFCNHDLIQSSFMILRDFDSEQFFWIPIPVFFIPHRRNARPSGRHFSSFFRCALALDEEERLKAELARCTKSERVRGPGATKAASLRWSVFHGIYHRGGMWFLEKAMVFQWFTRDVYIDIVGFSWTSWNRGLEMILNSDAVMGHMCWYIFWAWIQCRIPTVINDTSESCRSIIERKWKE